MSAAVTTTDQPPEVATDAPLSPKAEDRAAPQLTPQLRAEYEQLFASCRVRPERAGAVDAIVDRLVSSRSRYAALETPIGTPWYVPAVIHSLEAGLRFDRHLHNGDPLRHRTVHEPAGRPQRGSPPFSWEQSAIDALQLKNFDRWDDWSVGGVLFKLEQYNGWGYRLYHPSVRSPYLWSFSTHYTKGKYVADGRFDPNAVSQQCGAAVLLRRMVDRGLIEEWADPQAGPLLRFSGGSVLPRGEDLQRFLNTFPGVELVEDGKLGARSSDAFRRVTGYRLAGDPRL